MILGITGSIGSGKTTAAKIFSRYHFNRIGADEISHELMRNNKDLKNKLIKIFGRDILGRNKSIDRKKLGKIVFGDKNKLKKLNLVMHPVIIKEIKKRIKKTQKECGNDAGIVIDVPLLLESDAKNLVDKILVVKPSIKTIEKNKNFSKEEIKKISRFQMPLEEKLRHADFVISNDGGLNHLKKEIAGIIKKLKQ